MHFPEPIEPTSDEVRHMHDVLGKKVEVLALIVSARELSEAVMEHFRVNVEKDGIRPAGRLLEALDRVDVALGVELDDSPIEVPESGAIPIANPEGEGVEG